MSLLNKLKDEAGKNKTKLNTAEEQDLICLFNRMFYLEKNIELETQFIKEVMTRGLGTQERSGFHASDVIKGGSYCPRATILSIYYKQLQGDEVPINLKRIFAEGDAIHEKVQRLFIRAGYAMSTTLDRTRIDNSFKCSYTPDIVCRIPDFFNGVMVGEIKSVNPNQYVKMQEHSSGKDQLLLYMHLCIREKVRQGKWNGIDYTKGFTWMDNKGDQDFKINLYEYDPKKIPQIIERLEDAAVNIEVFERDKKLPPKHKECVKYDSDFCKKCKMRDVCYNKNLGRVKL